MLSLLPILALLATPATAQDDPATKPLRQRPDVPPTLAGLIVLGEHDLPRAEPGRFRTALAGLDQFESLDDGASVAAVVRLMLEAVSAPGSTVSLLDIESGAPVVVVATPGSLGENDGREGNVRWWAGFGLTYFMYQRGDAETEPTMVSEANERLRAAFADHRPTTTEGIELMLDLENLRRAWPQSLADGPARRVVAVTGLANARKVHVHVPDNGAVRLAYSSRALPPEEVSTRSGPEAAAGSAVGARWPTLFDAGLRTYAVALGEEPRQAFGQQFQQWMGQHGNRLRGIVQAVEIGMDWSVQQRGDGLRTEIVVPVREGIEVARLAEAMRATLDGSGFEAGDAGGTLALPEHLADALGGDTLSIGIDSQREPAVIRIVIE